MISRFVHPFALAILAGSVFAGCTAMNGEPLDGRYAIEKRFVRPIGADTLGVRLSDGLENASLSQAQIKKLSSLLSDVLRDSRRFGMVIDLTEETKDGGLDMVLDVSVTEFQAATEQQRSQGVRSKLMGQVSLFDEQNNNHGIAMVEATGMRLEVVGKNQPPDTVRFFASAILELLQ